MMKLRTISTLFSLGMTCGAIGCGAGDDQGLDTETVGEVPQSLDAACPANKEFEACTPNRWPGGLIPYEFAINPNVPGDSAWTAKEEADFKSLYLDVWEGITGGRIQFRESATASNRARFVRGKQGLCQSPYGPAASPELVSLRGCGATTLHELGHLIGLPHEHKRGDRDRYIQLDEKYLCAPPVHGSPPHIERCPEYAKDAAGNVISDGYCGFGSYEAFVGAQISDNITKCAARDGFDYGYGPYDLKSIVQYTNDPNGYTGPCPPITPQKDDACYLRARGGAVIPATTVVAESDASAVLEMYAEPDGWRRFVPIVSRDPGPTVPLDLNLAANVKVAGSPSLARENTSNLYAFAVGTNQHVYRKKFSGGRWSSGYWTDMGGNFAAEPAAVSWSAGNMDVVATGTDGQVYHLWMRNNVWGTIWEPLFKPTNGDTSAPAIASWGVDHLDIFVRSGQNVYQKTWNAGWSGWSDRGCCVTGKPSAVSWGPNRIDLVARGTDGAIWTNPFASGKWWGWASLGGSALANTSPSIASQQPDRLDVYTTGSNGRLWVRNWAGGPQWSNWRDIGGMPVGSPGATTLSNGQAHVLARLTNGGIYWKVKN